MNICMIGKYPPIEGGVSTETYWSARGLARKGHSVFVVTNANEVETTWRMLLTNADTAPDGEYARSFPGSGGSVRARSTEAPNASEMSHIPYNNPSVTRLATLATNLVRAERCDVIYSYYLEPYALAAHLASHWTGVPYVVKHAGSDLHRLARLPELRTAYIEVLRAADRIISARQAHPQVMACGVRPEQVTPDVGFGVPTEYFHPQAMPIDAEKLLSAPADWRTEAADPFRAPLEVGWPLLGVYGKLGEQKGSFDLLHGIARLARDGLAFHLVAVAHGPQESQFRQLVCQLGLQQYVRIAPFLPNWRVPGFIRRCTAIAFLERDFQIRAHASTIPHEVIASGTCLIVSEEVARKQSFRAQIRNGRNLIVVRAPTNETLLAESLRFALEDRGRAIEIGLRGHRELHLSASYERAIGKLEEVLMEVAREGRSFRTREPGSATRAGTPRCQHVRKLFPFTTELLDEPQLMVLRESLPAGFEISMDTSSSELSELFGSLLEGCLAPHPHAAFAREVCRYERLTNAWQARRRSAQAARGALVPLRQQLPDAVVPRLACECEMVTFPFDLRPLLTSTRPGYGSAPPTGGVTHLLFSAAAGPMIVGSGTAALFALLRQGVLTIGELEQRLTTGFDASDQGEARALRSVLEGLYWAGLITFHARRRPSLLDPQRGLGQSAKDKI